MVLDRILEDRVLHKEACVETLLGTLLGVQEYKKVKFSGRDISSLAVLSGLIYNHLYFVASRKESYLSSIRSKTARLADDIKVSKHSCVQKVIFWN